MLMNEKTILTIVLQKIKKCMSSFVYQVMTVKGSSECSMDKDLYPTLDCNMATLFEDQTNTVLPRKQLVRITPGWRSLWQF